MIPAPLKEGLFNTIGSVIKSQSWAQWFSKLVSKPALDPPGNSTLFLRGDDTWEVPGGFVPGAHANSHVANGSDPLVNLSQSQITDLTTDLAGKAETTTTITGSGLLTGEGGSLAANRTFDLVNSDIDHNQLTNYQANQHFLETSINHLNINSIGLNTHDQIDDHIEAIGATKEPTGFPNRSDSELSFVTGTRTFSITPTGVSFDVYVAGVKYTISAQDDIVISDTSGVHFIYYDGSTLTSGTGLTGAQIKTIITEKALISIVYWNANDGATYILSDERHGIVMSGETHYYLHNAIGSVYQTGLTVSGYVLDTDSDAALTFEVEDGEFDDEDIEHVISDGAPSNQYEQQLNGGDASITVLYRDDIDGSWTEDAASTLPYKTGGTGRLAIMTDDGDGTWSQTEVTGNDFCSCFLVATNDWQYPIKMVQGNTEYTTKAGALSGASNEIINWGDMPAAEFIILYQFIMQTKNSFGGTKKAKIIEIIDYRFTKATGASATAQSHGSLTGLGNDDHAQYLLADGSRDLTSSWEVTQEIIVSNKLSGKRDDIPTGVIDSALYGEYHADLPANTVQCAIFGYMKNTGTTPPVFGHGIGVLGLAEDVANSEQDIYGFEGRVNGISLHSGINYYGALGLCTFQNANFNGAVYGVQSRREITTDGSTPLAEGISVGFYAPAGIGGAINYSFWGQDQMRLDNNLVIFDTTAANYGIISKSAGGDLYITSDNGNVNLNTDDLITTGQVTSSELLVDTNTLAVNLPSYTDKVGINTVTPASSLDVVGDTRLGDSATNYTEVESDGDVVFNGGAGLCYGEIYAIDNSTVTTISASATDYQVTVFDTDGPYNNTTPDHTNDHITITKDGDYLINFSASISVAGGSPNFIKVKVMKNNGASLLGSLQLIRIFYGWGGEQDSASLSGIVGLSANDTVEVWARNMTNTDNYTFENISLNVTQVGG